VDDKKKIKVIRKNENDKVGVLMWENNEKIVEIEKK
jgi:hypothetical protein